MGVRVAHALGRPCVTGVKAIELGAGGVVARREVAGGWEVFEVPLPAVLGVKEGNGLDYRLPQSPQSPTHSPPNLASRRRLPRGPSPRRPGGRGRRWRPRA
ncbi:MAG: hypothetical protein WB297_08815 [Actinomycetota bacterium]